MKRMAFFLSLFLLLQQTSLSAQAPASFSWQGVARSNGEVLTGTVPVRLSIRQGSPGGSVVFTEDQNITTSPQGVLNVEVGTVNTAAFNAIPWQSGTFFLEVAVNAGSGFQTLGSSQILSVPYALFARQSATATDDLDRDPTNELQSLSLNGQVLTLSQNGNSVTLPSPPVFSAGTGISINNNVITNTAPAVNPTLSLNGQILTVNPGGSNVTLPSGSGNEIWSEVNNFAQYTKNGARLFTPGSPDTLSMRPFSINLKANDPSQTLNIQKNALSIIEGSPTSVDSLRITPFEVFLRSRIFTAVMETSYGNGRIFHGAQFPEFIIESENARFTGSVGIRTSSPPDRSLSVNNTLSIRNGSDQEGIFLQTYSDGEGDLRLHGPNSLNNAILRGTGPGSNHGFLGLYNANGNLRTQVTLLDNGAGFVRTDGENGNSNIRLSTLSNFANHGFVAVQNSAGDTRAGIFVNSSGEGQLFTDPGNKNFRMEHPDLKDEDIWYCSLEGPEAGVYDRGTGRLSDGEAFIEYAQHFSLVMNPATITVTVTPHSADTYGLAVTEKTERGFRVKELKGGKGHFTFDWEAKGKIAGHEGYRVFRPKSEVKVAESNDQYEKPKNSGE